MHCEKKKKTDKVRAADLISYTNNYNYTLYLFIGCKFCQIHCWITFFFPHMFLHAYKTPK